MVLALEETLILLAGAVIPETPEFCSSSFVKHRFFRYSIKFLSCQVFSIFMLCNVVSVDFAIDFKFFS